MAYKEIPQSQKQKQVYDELEKRINVKENGTIWVAVEGMSGSGKSTFGAQLAEYFSCNLFHMDDYFLRPEQRTEERLNEIGGNVDYERFKEEIISLIPNAKKVIDYRIYDCKTQSLSGVHKAEQKKLNIVEGSYSMHPYFGECYDYKIFMEVAEDVQKERILKRNGELMLPRFLNEWIPKENDYFREFQIREKCNIIISI